MVSPVRRVVVQFENSHKGLPFRSAVLSREESVVFLLAASRFLADKPGFGMTRVGLFLRKLYHDRPTIPIDPTHLDWAGATQFRRLTIYRLVSGHLSCPAFES
jgi:hypothetical protein